MLNTLKPNLHRLTEISRSIACNGYFVLRFDSGAPDILTAGRMFDPAIGIAEDPVTGKAHGLLGACIVKYNLAEVAAPCLRFIALQGEAIGRTGVVEACVNIEGTAPASVRVGGRAVIAFKTKITL